MPSYEIPSATVNDFQTGFTFFPAAKTKDSEAKGSIPRFPPNSFSECSSVSYLF